MGRCYFLNSYSAFLKKRILGKNNFVIHRTIFFLQGLVFNSAAAICACVCLYWLLGIIFILLWFSREIRANVLAHSLQSGSINHCSWWWQALANPSTSNKNDPGTCCHWTSFLSFFFFHPSKTVHLQFINSLGFLGGWGGEEIAFFEK